MYDIHLYIHTYIYIYIYMYNITGFPELGFSFCRLREQGFGLNHGLGSIRALFESSFQGFGGCGLGIKS